MEYGILKYKNGIPVNILPNLLTLPGIVVSAVVLFNNSSTFVWGYVLGNGSETLFL
jgi:hypothetical protein